MTRRTLSSLVNRPPSYNDTPSFSELKHFYVQLVTHIVPGPLSVSYFLPPLLLSIALLVHPDTLSHGQLFIYFYVASVAFTAHAWWSMGGVDVMSVDCLLWAGFLIGWGGDGRRWRRVWVCEGECDRNRITSPVQSKDDSGAQMSAIRDKEIPFHYHEQAYPTSLLPRLNFVFNALASTRLHRWLIDSPSHNRRQRALPLHPPPTRAAFSLALVPSLLLDLFILLPLTSQLARWDSSVESVHPLPNATRPYSIILLQHYIPARILSPLTLGTHTYALLTLGHSLPAPLICMSNYLLGIPSDTWSPHTLPSHFGGFVEVFDHGVAGLWGKWWHAHMKVMCSAPGEAIARWLAWGEIDDASTIRDEIRGRRVWGRYALMVVSAFFLSGITHMGLVPPRAPQANVLRLRIAAFFWVQAIAILFETGVATSWTFLLRYTMQTEEQSMKDNARQNKKTAEMQNIHTRYNMSRKTTAWNTVKRLSILVWVLGWLSATLPLLEGPFDQLSWWRIWPPPLLGHRLRMFMVGDWIP